MFRRILAPTIGALALLGLAVAGPVSAAQAGKTTICHLSDEFPYAQTITVSDNALTAHKKHGDTVGACVTTIKVKKVTDPTTDTGKFNLLVNGNTVATDVGNGGSGSATVGPNSSNTFGETAGTGTSLSDYDSRWSCDNGVTTATTGTGTSGTVTARAGRTTVCTITNKRHAATTATIQVLKKTVPADNSLWNFVVTNGSNETYQTFTDKSTPFDSGVITVNDPTAIEVDEWAGTGGDIAGYHAAVTCTEDGNAVTPTASDYYQVGSETRFFVFFPITAGHAYVCTFTNTREQAAGTVNWTAFGLARTTSFTVTGNPAGGTFHYSDANNDSYDVNVTCSSFSGSTAYFAGLVSNASQPAWNGMYLSAKVTDNSPDQVWGSFSATDPCPTIGTVDPADGPFAVTSGDLTVVSAP